MLDNRRLLSGSAVLSDGEDHRIAISPSCQTSDEEDHRSPRPASVLFCSCCMPMVTRRPSHSPVADAIPHPAAKWLFIMTNLPYFMAAACIFTGRPLADSLFECTRRICASPIFFGCLISSLACVSTYWHGAQMQIRLPRACRWVYGGHSSQGGALLLHSAAWLKHLVVADVACSVLTTLVGVSCFGPARTFSWLLVPLIVFALGARAKRRGEYVQYAFLHGAWHILSAVAIGAIMLDGGTPFYFESGRIAVAVAAGPEPC